MLPAVSMLADFYIQTWYVYEYTKGLHTVMLMYGISTQRPSYYDIQIYELYNLLPELSCHVAVLHKVVPTGPSSVCIMWKLGMGWQ